MKLSIKASWAHQLLITVAGILLVVLMLGVPNPVRAGNLCQYGKGGCNASSCGVSISCGTCAADLPGCGCACEKIVSGGGAILSCTGYCLEYID
jgi:hypothetical protein